VLSLSCMNGFLKSVVAIHVLLAVEESAVPLKSACDMFFASA